VDALVALGAGLLVGLVAHRLAGEEPLATDPEYVGHVFAELLIVLFAALIVYWLLDDMRAARRKERTE
jgi:Na+/H+-dicarboxylate symporter